MKFDEYNISKEIKKSLDELNLKRPTDIQYKSIPHILKGEDVLAIAQTGTGKTAAFAIPILSKLHEKKKRARRKDGIKCIVMVPTRELASQITDAFQEIGKYTIVKTFGLYGGVDQEPQIAQLEEGVDILVATPGRLFDLVSQKHLRLHRVDTLILDEADHMLDLGFYKDIQDLLRHIPAKRQTLFFSATIDKNIKKLAYSLVNKPIRIQVSPKNPVAKNVEHSLANIKMDDKRFFLERLANENEDKKILVFVRTKVRAERVSAAMKRVEIESMTIHGDKEQEKRQEALDKFKNGEVNMLIATDVSARGIDIPNVEYVINYDLPDRGDTYVHRVGRTGRGKNKGFAVSFCSDEEKEYLQDIEEYIGGPIEVVEIDHDSYLDTLDFTADHDNNWKYLLKQSEKEQKEIEKIKKKRRKKK